MRRSEATKPEPTNSDDLFRGVGGPSMGVAYDRITARALTLDPLTEYDRLEQALKMAKPASQCSYGELADELGEADDRAWLASRLAAHAGEAREAFELDAKVLEASLLERARTELMKLKEKGEYTKAIHNTDVEQYATQYFAAEYKDLAMRRTRAKRMVDVIDALATRMHHRRTTLETLVSRARG